MQEVLKGSVALVREGLCGQGGELCGRREACVSGLDHELFLLGWLRVFRGIHTARLGLRATLL